VQQGWVINNYWLMLEQAFRALCDFKLFLFIDFIDMFPNGLEKV